MASHPIESWSGDMDRDELLAWATHHASWSADAWGRDDVQSWTSTFADDVEAHIRRGIGPESYRGIEDLIERGWGLREFFAEEIVTVVDVAPPAVILYNIVMRSEDGNEVGIFIAHRIDHSGHIAEIIVHDDDAPRVEVDAGVAMLREHHEHMHR